MKVGVIIKLCLQSHGCQMRPASREVTLGKVWLDECFLSREVVQDLHIHAMHV